MITKLDIKQKKEPRINILDAALIIGRTEGWHALTMRKIAVSIKRPVPTLYQYFPGKEAIFAELNRIGFLRLISSIECSMQVTSNPEQMLEAMWLAYWNFSIIEKAHYQLMFGLGIYSTYERSTNVEAEILVQLFQSVIRKIYADESVSEIIITSKYYSFWSLVHGLIAINHISKNIDNSLNETILATSISRICKTITD